MSNCCLRRAVMWKRGSWLIFLILSSEIIQGVKSEFSYEAITAVLARINVSYVHPVSNMPLSDTAEIGRFAEGAVGAAGGVLVIGKPPTNSTSRILYLQGCIPRWASPPTGEPWVALLLRGGCTDEEKVRLALNQNASAVLLFGNDPEAYLPKDTKFQGDAIVVYLLRRRGDQLSSLVANGTKVYVSISKGQEVKFRITSINRTSVLFVSVSFIVLMVVSLAWLIFYYIQRFRYINAKDRLAKHLNNAAKKALAKIPVKNVKSGEKELEDSDSCAVCIELYAVGDTLRYLPCKHEFHKGCVDPWLIEHRTCPMCKMDILKYYGYIPADHEGHHVTRADAANQASVPESNAARRLQQSNEITRPTAPPLEGSLQVSVISPSGIVTRTDSIGNASTTTSNANNILTPVPSGQTTSPEAATTAIIRSVILPPTSQTVPANDSLPNRPSDIDSTAPRPDGSILVNLSERSYNPLNGEDKAKEPTANMPSPFDQTGELVEVLSDRSSSEPHLSDQSIQSFQTLSSPPSQSNLQGGPSASDLTCLVNEIFDSERDDTSEMRTDTVSSQAVPQTSILIQDSESEQMTTDQNQIAIPKSTNPPKSGCPMTTPNQPQLPVVDVNAQTTISLGIDDSSPPNYLARRPSRHYASNNSDDVEELRRQDSTQSDDARRPSSHLVTISHS